MPRSARKGRTASEAIRKPSSLPSNPYRPAKTSVTRSLRRLEASWSLLDTRPDCNWFCKRFLRPRRPISNSWIKPLARLCESLTPELPVAPPAASRQKGATRAAMAEGEASVAAGAAGGACGAAAGTSGFTGGFTNGLHEPEFGKAAPMPMPRAALSASAGPAVGGRSERAARLLKAVASSGAIGDTDLKNKSRPSCSSKLGWCSMAASARSCSR
mmetsp:Transcript_65357/g.184493  ORF Transcript_65357/g.184493 Transcript_65357/m.184493 type:complete len:215 (-) Transcript_65357:725-1369(-)